MEWKTESFRLVASCGSVAVGFVFPGKPIRYRIWLTESGTPAEGTARSMDAAKQEVEKRFSEFLKKSDLKKA